MPVTPHSLGLHKVLRLLSPALRPLLNRGSRRRLREAVNIADLRAAAENRVHSMCFGYLDSGGDDEVTLRRNKDAYSELEMHFHVLAGLEPPLDLSTTLFGKKVSLPFFACPTAGNRMFHTEGETATARAALHHNSVYCLSSISTTGIPDISAILPEDHPKLFQVYVWRDRDLLKDVLEQARQGGFHSLALTVDFSWYGNRERDIRNGFTIPPAYTAKQMVEAAKRPAWTWDFLSTPAYRYALLEGDLPADSLASFINSQIYPAFSWKDAEWLCSQWEGPKAIKGICRPEDAVRALEAGFTTIWVSNHGGRQLDTSPATISVLPDIRAAVGPDVEIILDGGVQRGTDIAKGLAMGADGVGVGKPYLYGLCAGGTEGVVKALDILRVELDRAMGLLGVATVEELKRRGPELIKKRAGSSRDGQGARYSSSGII